jgi:hypothetical protein
LSFGIFVFGMVVSAMVAAACWLVLTGIQAERRDRDRLEREHADAIAAGRERRTQTLADGSTVSAE